MSRWEALIFVADQQSGRPITSDTLGGCIDLVAQRLRSMQADVLEGGSDGPDSIIVQYARVSELARRVHP